MLRKNRLVVFDRKVSKTIVLIASIGLLTACAERAPEPAAESVVTPKYFKDTSGRYVADPIAQASVNSPPGSNVQVVLGNGTTLTVKVGGDYNSADGAKCRSIIVNHPEKGAQRNAVCNENGVWKTVLNDRLN